MEGGLPATAAFYCLPVLSSELILKDSKQFFKLPSFQTLFPAGISQTCSSLCTLGDTPCVQMLNPWGRGLAAAVPPPDLQVLPAVEFWLQVSD